MASTKILENLIRKIKKKLRQIENLERLNRPLFDEELVKVRSKVSLRLQLKQNLQELRDLKEEEEDEEEIDHEQHYKAGLSEQFYQGDLSESFSELTDQTEESFDLANIDNYNNSELDEDVLHKGAEEILQQINKSPDVSANKKIEQQCDESTSLTSENRKSEKESSSTASQKVKTAKPKSTKVSSLSRKSCRVTSLDGHNDLITSLVVVGDRLISASRDTTLRSWNISTGEEEHIFGGHTEYVTCVSVLDKTWNHKFDPAVPEDDSIIVSGSFDCSLRLWSLNTGRPIKSVYTFNPITCICVCQKQGLLVSGSDGGKLELWELWSGSNCWSKIVYDGSVTGIKVSASSVYSSSSTGVIKVHQLSDSRELSCVFESENLKSSSGRNVSLRHVRCLEVAESGILYGDDARNIKIVDWKKGVVHKVSNHNNSFSSIDALCCHDGYLVSSSYDLATGLGYINVRSSQTLDYLGSLDDDDTERLVCLATQPRGQEAVTVFSGGMNLKMWEIGDKRSSSQQSDSVVIPVQSRPDIGRRPVDSDSDMSSDEEDGGSEEDSEEGEKREMEEVPSAGWGSWCTVL